MQKTRPRRPGKQPTPTGDAEQTPTVGRGRPTHVRNRLIVAVAVVAAAIAGAGAPGVLAASAELSDSQDLVTLAEQTQDALSLAHSLADERDEVTSYIAAGRPRSKAPSEQHSARVDRQVEEMRADSDTSETLRKDLDAVSTLRRAALTGKSTALEAHEAYSAAITELHRLAERLADRTPPRAGSGAHSLAELDTAVQQAAATRGLLLAAFSVPSTEQTVFDPLTGAATTTAVSSEADAKRRDELTAAAVEARLRSDAALAGFRETAPKEARSSYDSTVSGHEVNSAEKYLAKLTDAPTLSDSDLATSTKKLQAALTARVETMRGVESSLYEKRSKELAQLRDDDVTALEIRIALLGALMLVAVAIATAMARTLTRPLSVLRRGSARLAGAEDPVAEDPITFTGRNDEFAQVVRSVNALHAHAAGLAERVATLEADRKHLVGQRQKMADAREELRAELAESAAHLERLRTSIGGTFVNLALRTLGLVERQLGVIEGLEEREDDPDRLATLFKLDHFATVMRRHSENLLVLAGTEHVQHTAGPVPLVDVVRAAVSEIERYERVRIAALPPHAHIAGFAADDLSHLLAELMENATSFSPPDLPVEVSGWLLENGEVMLSVQDEGIGMAADRLERLNERLSAFDPEAPYEQEGEDGLGLGLYVVARLAQRHGLRVKLREQKQGGIAAVVVVPQPLLADPSPTAVPASGPVAGGAQSYALAGADAEANSNVLHGRTESDDPLVDLAEQAVRRQQPAAEEPAVEEPGAEGPGAQGVDAPDAEESVAQGADARDAEESVAQGTDEHDADVRGASGSAAVGAGRAADRTAAGAAETGDDAAPRLDADEADADATGADAPGADEAEADAPGADEAEADATGADEADADAPDARTPEPAERDASEAVDHGAAEDDTDGRDTDAQAPAAERAAGHDAHARPDAGAPERAEQRPGGDHATDATADSGDTDGVDDTGEERDDAPAVPAQRPAEMTMELLIPAPSRPGDDRPTGPEATPPAAADDSPTEPGTATAPDAEHARVPDGPAADEPVAEEPVTAKGLPKRTPRITAPAEAPRPRTGSVDAEALRRRLGGFHRGAEAGYRDVEAEISEQTGPHRAPSAAAPQPARARDTGGTGAAATEEATGGTVEEASS
ncbi:nitrate- and nitrite sensing domain-containing protein [Streptomyces sp. NPDC056956]|uniref:sensor histidine kinase n=1 Tax=Streptomyces sp. NPDC056956 TaxID=3345980 RepID=UPI0036253B31